MVMTMLALFHVLMPHEDKTCSVIFFSGVLKAFRLFKNGAQRKMLAEVCYTSF